METFFTYSRVLKKQRDKLRLSVKKHAGALLATGAPPKPKRQANLLARLRFASASQNADQ
jgi:hypothetical protein